ncbi:M23 family metallopeptidase [Marinicella sp. W31]|uniref:M23 family metallopeptidase n=1 Tax=Marinicella sp. W31 TaxID=3023713 RepID=UPI0037565DF3
MLLCFSYTTFSATESDRPHFLAPYSCGQSWDAGTYSTHKPDPDSVDFGLWRDSDDKFPLNEENRSKGQPVLASAAGIVIDDLLVNTPEFGLERHVYLDHGDDWYTHYVHLQRSPAPLLPGRRIAQGEKIGRTGRTGTVEFNHHIHYTQMKNDVYPPQSSNWLGGGFGNGQAVRVKLNGQLIDTHASNPSSLGTYFTNDAERIISRNCPGNSFIHWDDDDLDYLLRYKPSERKARIMRLNKNGQGATTTAQLNDWNKTWTHFAMFYATSGRPHLIQYNTALGKASFGRLDREGAGITNLTTSTHWHKGWTQVKTFLLGDYNYVLTYDSQSGMFNISRIHNDSRGVTTIYHDTQHPGWTSIVPFDGDGGQYLLFYSGGRGTITIQRVSGNRDNLSMHHVWSAQRKPGWTSLELVKDRGDSFLLGYNITEGTGKIWQLSYNGNGITSRSEFSLRDDWTNVTTYSENIHGRVLFYDASSGDVRIKAVDNGGIGITSKWSGDWDDGWR